MGARLTVEHLAVDVDVGGAAVGVVDDVSFVVDAGRAVALVGESGSGKTLTALALVGLLPAGARARGRVVVDVDGSVVDVIAADEAARRRVRGGQIGFVFQEPMSALNPLMRVCDQAGEALRAHRGMSRRDARTAATTLLGSLGVPPERARAYPHELSGGQRQRVMIASALAAAPRFVVADEPTTALDVTLQAQILAVLKAEQTARGLGLLLITHDLAVVSGVCDDVVVLYGGRVVEAGPVVDVFARPQHPYTRALLAAMPSEAPRGAPLPAIPGQVPSVGRFPSGCRFRDRCAFADDACAVDVALVDVDVGNGRRVRCVRPLGASGGAP